jgi:alanine-glyoxylate transaminase/serine-glyoxylate transaminase/serine-pyruvate transaminase
MDRFQLSLPGPTEYDPEVLQELMRPTLPHYGELWMCMYEQLVTRLKELYGTTGTVYTIPGSGSAAIDAVFTSLGAKRGIVLSNGAFGERISVIASRHLASVRVIERSAGESFDPEAIEDVAKKERYDLLAMVHGETSTGMLNQLTEVAAICRRQGLLFIVDAISTLGGSPLRMDDEGIDFCVSASQKAVGAPPGIAMVAVNARGWAAMPPEREIRGWYLNLRTWKSYGEEWGDWHPYPVTLPVSLLFCLNKALEILLREGLQERWRRHARVSEETQARLVRLGIAPFIDRPDCRLSTVTAAVLPSGLSSSDLQAFLQKRFGIFIAGGIGPLRQRIFRIGHMGYSAQSYLIARVLAGVRDFMESGGRDSGPAV